VHASAMASARAAKAASKVCAGVSPITAERIPDSVPIEGLVKSM
jgi:hypothetical protein